MLQIVQSSKLSLGFENLLHWPPLPNAEVPLFELNITYLLHVAEGVRVRNRPLIRSPSFTGFVAHREVRSFHILLHFLKFGLGPFSLAFPSILYAIGSFLQVSRLGTTDLLLHI
jgi:hypothetical protein